MFYENQGSISSSLKPLKPLPKWRNVAYNEKWLVNDKQNNYKVNKQGPISTY